jgi:hypothetical protein
VEAYRSERPEVRLEQEVLEWANAVYEEACTDQEASPESKQVQRIIDFIEGKQWNSKARYGRSRPVANRVVRQFIEMASLLTDIEPDIQIHFTDQIENYSQIEELMNRMLTDWAKMSDFEQELLQIVCYGLITQGPAKVQWNPYLRSGLGDVEVQALSPLDFMQIGASGKLHPDAEVCISRRVVTKPWLVRRFGDVAIGVESDADTEMSAVPTKPAGMSSRRWMSLSPLMRNIHSKLAANAQSGTKSRYPKVIYKEFWFKDDSIWDGSESIIIGDPNSCWSYRVEPGMPKYPRGRVIAIAGGKVLEDAPNPYWHGRLPFALYRPLRVPWKFEGLSVMEPQVAIQGILNRIEGGILDVISSTIDPTIIAPMAAFSEQDKDSLDAGAPGGKIFYRNNSPRPPEFRKPPELGNYVMPTADRLEKEMAASSGAAAINQTLQKKQVPGGDSLDMILNSRSTPMRLYGRGLQSFLEEAGYMVIANKLQFETASKRVAQYGWRGLTDSDFYPYYYHLCPAGMEPEQFVRNASFTIRKGSLLAIEKQEEMGVMSSLVKAGIVDSTTYLEFLNAKFQANLNIDKIKQRVALEQAQKAQAAMAMGQAQHAAKEKSKSK